MLIDYEKIALDAFEEFDKLLNADWFNFNI